MKDNRWIKLAPIFICIITISVLFILVSISLTSKEPASYSKNAIIDKGNLIIGYATVETAKLRDYEQIFKESSLFEGLLDELNNNLILPYDVSVVLGECGEANAYYSSEAKQITICYELMDHFAEIFYDYSETDSDLGASMLNSMIYVFYHELGHMLIDIYDLPTTGNEEDNADQVSTLILVGAGEDGVNALLDGANWFFITSEETKIRESMLADSHSLDRRRYYNILCWAYGSDPQDNEYLITEWGLPEERAIGCEEEYIKMYDSWDYLLSPYEK